MSYFGKNIRKIRKVKSLSQSGFAELFGLTRASVGAYEEGRAEPKIDTIIEIAGYFNISIDDILSKELTINDLYQFDIFKEKGIHPAISRKKSTSNSIKKVVLLNDNLFDPENIPSTTSFENDDSLKFEIPADLIEGDYFLKVGNNLSFLSKDLNVGEWLTLDLISKSATSFKNLIGKKLILLSENKIASGEILSETKEQIKFGSDHNNSTENTIKKSDIISLFLIVSVINANRPSEQSLTSRMENIENELRDLKNKLT